MIEKAGLLNLSSHLLVIFYESNEGWVELAGLQKPVEKIRYAANFEDDELACGPLAEDWRAVFIHLFRDGEIPRR